MSHLPRPSSLLARAAAAGLLALGLALAGAAAGEPKKMPEVQDDPKDAKKVEPVGVPKAGPAPELARQALAILKTNCAKCHGPDGTNEGNVNYILDRNRLVEKRRIKPGAPD